MLTLLVPAIWLPTAQAVAPSGTIDLASDADVAIEGAQLGATTYDQPGHSIMRHVPVLHDHL